MSCPLTTLLFLSREALFSGGLSGSLMSLKLNQKRSLR